MNLSVKAIEVLLNAERQLVVLANEAGANRDYDGATTLLEAARHVKSITNNHVAVAAVQSAEPIPAIESGTDTTTAPARAIPKRPRKSDYPKFVCDGDALVKIGWSKAEKCEYEHKSPKKVLTALGHALLVAGAKGKRFSMDKLLPLSDPVDSTELPGYQCYLCLAWLRDTKLVVQHGRQGYSLPKNVDLMAAIEQNWKLLPSRS